MASRSSNFDGGLASASTLTSPWLRSELVASWPEIVAVLGLTVGYYIYCSTKMALYRLEGHALHLRETNYSALHLIAELSAILSLFLLFLGWRGWTARDLKINVGWWQSFQAVPLLVANWLLVCVGVFLTLVWNRSHPSYTAGMPHIPAHIAHLSWFVAIPHQLVNAYFEEVVCMSYAFNQFAAKRGPLIAMGLMLLLRIAYHSWKSPIFLCITVIHFSIYGLWYWRFRTVWPLILAHTCYDLFLDRAQVH